jgi:hypothetical protein
MLGAYTMEKLSGDCDGDFRKFIRDIFNRHFQQQLPAWLQGVTQKQNQDVW